MKFNSMNLYVRIGCFIHCKKIIDQVCRYEDDQVYTPSFDCHIISSDILIKLSFFALATLSTRVSPVRPSIIEVVKQREEGS